MDVGQYFAGSAHSPFRTGFCRLYSHVCANFSSRRSKWSKNSRCQMAPSTCPLRRVVGHDTDLQHLPTQPLAGTLEAFDRHADRRGRNEDGPALRAAGGHKADDRLLQRQPDRDARQMCPLRARLIHRPSAFRFGAMTRAQTARNPVGRGVRALQFSDREVIRVPWIVKSYKCSRGPFCRARMPAGLPRTASRRTRLRAV